MLPAGETIAYDQMSIRDYKAPELKLENKQSSNIAVVVPSFHDNDRNYLIVSGEDFTLEFNKHNGYLCRYDVSGMQLMEDGSALTLTSGVLRPTTTLEQDYNTDMPHGRIRN